MRNRRLKLKWQLSTGKDFQTVISADPIAVGRGKRSGTDSRRKAVHLRAGQIASRREEHKALVVKGGPLGKGGESGTQRGVSERVANI